MSLLTENLGRYNVVIITTRYRLDGPEVEYPCGCDFPHPFRPALSPSFVYTMGTGPFPEGDLSWCGFDHPT